MPHDLQPTPSFWITHGEAHHLGDLINVVQQCVFRSMVHRGAYKMFSRVNPSTLKEIIGFLNTDISFAAECPEVCEIMTPPWVRTHVPNFWTGKRYMKAALRVERKRHVVCHFDARSNLERKTLPTQVVERLVTADMINIGDAELPCVNATRASLGDKLELIASAQRCIGIDSGLTHLALMTDTPIEVYHPYMWPAHKFYPFTPQIKFKRLPLLSSDGRPAFAVAV